MKLLRFRRSGGVTIAIIALISASTPHLFAQEQRSLHLGEGLTASPGRQPMTRNNTFLVANGALPLNDSVSQKSPLLAFALSALSTGIPVGIALAEPDAKGSAPAILFTSGLVLGPLVGYLYGGVAGRGLLGAGIRFGVTGLTYLAAASTAGPSFSSLGSAVVVLVLGTAFVGVDAIYDILAVGGYVNEQNNLNRVFGVSVTPTYSFSTQSTGIQLTISF